jgi:Peptidase family M23
MPSPYFRRSLWRLSSRRGRLLAPTDQVHLAYELSFVNDSKLLLQIDSIVAVDADTGTALAEWKDKKVAEVFRVNGGDPGTALAPSHSGYAFLDVALPSNSAPPKAIRHRIVITRLTPDPNNEHKGTALDPKANMPGTVTFEGALTPVDGKALVVASPLRGPGWVAINGCCAQISAHRGAVLPFDGKAYIAQRFAIDFVRVGADGRLFSGPVDQLTSYPFFGVPVYAAADGTVVEATDGLAEQIPGGTLVGITVDTLPGNHIVVDMGNGNFALYAHIKTGTVAVKVGDHVKPGDVIGHLGNTGNTSAPHLHFHVMDGPSPLASNGLPYEIEGFQSAGMLQPEDSFFEKGDPGKIDRSWFPGSHQNELPLENEVVDFPGAQ